MRVLVRYFAVLREHRATHEEWVTVAPGTTVADLHGQLFGGGDLGRLPVLFAVNQAYAPGARLLADGDEVAFIPPVGGG